VQPLIVAEQLHVERALVEDESFERPAAGDRYDSAFRPRPGARTQCPDKAHEIARFLFRQIGERRHPGTGQPLTKERRQIRIASQRYSQRNGRAELAAVAVAAVAAGTTADEHLASGIRRLSRGKSTNQQDEQIQNRHAQSFHDAPSRAQCSPAHTVWQAGGLHDEC
jgi:hypothetical protein